MGHWQHNSFHQLDSRIDNTHINTCAQHCWYTLEEGAVPLQSACLVLQYHCTAQWVAHQAPWPSPSSHTCRREWQPHSTQVHASAWSTDVHNLTSAITTVSFSTLAYSAGSLSSIRYESLFTPYSEKWEGIWAHITLLLLPHMDLPQGHRGKGSQGPQGRSLEGSMSAQEVKPFKSLHTHGTRQIGTCTWRLRAECKENCFRLQLIRLYLW